MLAYLPNTLVWVSMFCRGAGGEHGAWLLETWRPKEWDQRERQRKGAREGACVYVREAQWTGALETWVYAQLR